MCRQHMTFQYNYFKKMHAFKKWTKYVSISIEKKIKKCFKIIKWDIVKQSVNSRRFI